MANAVWRQSVERGVSFLSFFRHVARLAISYTAFGHYETLARRSGPRIVHADFCIISDRPRVLKIDAQNRPHCDDGPFCSWSDGFKIYAIHGVYVPRYVVERPELITAAQINAESNAEVRRIMIERMGAGRYFLESGATVVHADRETAKKGAAYRVLLRDKTGSQWLYCTDGGTGRKYYLPVPGSAATCREAHEAICGFDEGRILVKS